MISLPILSFFHFLHWTTSTAPNHALHQLHFVKPFLKTSTAINNICTTRKMVTDMCHSPLVELQSYSNECDFKRSPKPCR